MIQEIKTIEDVKQFAKDLISEGCVFHPDDDFNDYIDIDIKTKPNAFSLEEADLRNDLMSQCFAICEKEQLDIYEIMLIQNPLN